MSTVITEELQALSDAAAHGTGQELETAIRALCDEIRQSPGLSPDCLCDVVAALDGAPESCHPEARMEALIEAANHLYMIGSRRAIGAAETAVRHARRCRHRPLLRKALNTLGMTLADSGDIPRAIEIYAEALDIAEDIGDAVGKSSAYINLGAALTYAAQYHDAVACFEHVIAKTDGSGSLNLHGIAHADLALSYLFLGENERGLRAAEASLRDLPEPATEYQLVSRTLRETYYARLLLEVGKVESAGERVRLARGYATRSRSMRAEIVATNAEGLYLVHAGEREQGLDLLTSGLARARQHMPVMLRDCLRALYRAYDVLGLPAQAIGHHQELIEVTRQWQCDVVLQNLRHRFPALDAEHLGNAAFAARMRGEEAALRGKVSRQELFRAPMEMLERMAVTAELRDDSTGEHCYRVGTLSALLAREMGWKRAEIERLELAARLHDIGKIAVPDEVILKRGRLTDAEREVVAAHAKVGADLLSRSNIPGIEMAADIALHHHDWWDGSRGAGGGQESIPVAARIVALAEVFDALTHERAHRSAWSMREAVEEISRLKGTQFEPRLADAFIAMVRRIACERRDLDAFLGEAAKSSGFLRARSRIRDALRESSRHPV